MENIFQELSLSIELVKALLDKTDACIYLTDKETKRVLYINEKMKRDFHCQDQEDQFCWEVFYNNQSGPCDYCPCDFLKSIGEKPVVRFVYNERAKRYYKQVDSIVRLYDGRHAYLHHFFDITEFKEATQAVAEASDKVRTDFLSRMSHEIRTPMNAIIGMAHIAAASDDIDKIKTCISKIDSASTQLLSLVNDILDMSKFESEKMDIINEPFDLEKMLIEMYNIVMVKAEEKNQNLQLEFGRDVPSKLRSDELRISQVITNLVTNAIKFTPEYGDIKIKVNVIGEVSDTVIIEFRVSDTGIGIASQDQAKLFGTFEQIDGSLSRQYGGAGLGLAICKRIIDLMGGKIWVESREGEGSTFGFTLQMDVIERKNKASTLLGCNFEDLRILLGANAFPIIAMTANASGEDVAERLNTGINGHIVKPINEQASVYGGLLPYIDVEDALAKIRGNKKLFMTMLKSYRNGTVYKDMFYSLETRNLGKAQYYVHTLKGVAENLSLKKISEVIVPFEKQLKSHILKKEILPELKEAVEITNRYIDELLSDWK